MKKSESKFRIQLGNYNFDPLEDPPELTADLSLDVSTKTSAHHIIQFKKTLTKEDKKHLLDAYGLPLAEYIPNFAFLENISPQTLLTLSKDPLYRASFPLQPAFKISATIGTLEFRTPERQDTKGLQLLAILFPETDAAQVVNALQEKGASEVKLHDDRNIGGYLRVHFLLGSKDVLSEISQLEDVRWIEEVAEFIEDNVNTAGTIQSGTPGNEPIWDQGIHGEGQVIGILDSGPLDINHCFFRDAGNNTPRAAHRKVIQIRNTSNTNAGRHATFVAGNAAGDDLNNLGNSNQRGSAWASRLVSGNTRDGSTTLAELNAAATAGATIHSNSWHDNTAGAGNPATYNQTARDVDNFTWNNEDHLVLGSAGNNGEEQGPPGTAKNAICVGASQADPNEMNFGDGNPGPTADGRRKPDLMTPGCGISSATVNTTCGTGVWPSPAPPVCATSFATPHAAGSAALIRQYFTEGWYPTGTRLQYNSFTPSGALLKAMLINSAINMTGILGFPSINEGWGLVRLDSILFFRDTTRTFRVVDVRNADGLNTGDTDTHMVNLANNNESLKIIMVWTDPPGAVGTVNPFINDLNLVVTSPDGTQTFLGNRFLNGVSANGGASDAINNVEAVLVNNPMPGAWTINVNATNVNVGNPGQGYALAIRANINPMISFTISQYQVFMLTGSNQPVRIYMTDEKNKYRGYIDFIKDYTGARNYIVYDNGIINAFMPLSKLHPTLDILRNETPVYFVVNETYNWAALQTGNEPTGDEEL